MFWTNLTEALTKCCNCKLFSLSILIHSLNTKISNLFAHHQPVLSCLTLNTLPYQFHTQLTLLPIQTIMPSAPLSFSQFLAHTHVRFYICPWLHDRMNLSTKIYQDEILLNFILTHKMFESILKKNNNKKNKKKSYATWIIRLKNIIQMQIHRNRHPWGRRSGLLQQGLLTSMRFCPWECLVCFNRVF